jgi:Ni/Co efflux regulator RcnB
MKKLIVAIVAAAFTSLAMAQAAAPVAELAAVASPATTAKKTKAHNAGFFILRHLPTLANAPSKDT